VSRRRIWCFSDGTELAAGRNPRDLLRALTEQPRVRTFAQWAENYRESRADKAMRPARTPPRT
jgi:hypothetical protein